MNHDNKLNHSHINMTNNSRNNHRHCLHSFMFIFLQRMFAETLPIFPKELSVQIFFFYHIDLQKSQRNLSRFLRVFLCLTCFYLRHKKLWPLWHSTFPNLSRCVIKILVTVSKNIIHNNQSHALNYFTSKFDNFLLDKIF